MIYFHFKIIIHRLTYIIMKTLLIVESPAKSKTIEKLLGPGYIVLSSFGHIRNLDDKNMGIDVENGFKPTYKIMNSRSKEIKKINDVIKTVDRVFLASDEDREGEAIAWHCAVVFKLKLNEKNRICFHEITKTALENAVANPRYIDMNMVNSQQARRILDRLVGFKLSPLLWKYIAPKLSAGRVQSAALKLIVDKEREIDTFTEHKYYKTISSFDNNIIGNLDKKFEKEEESIAFLNDCKTAIYKIVGHDKKKNEIRPPPPYITSTIQQDIGVRFGLPAKKIMSVLQHLYESGHITYHRTDSTLLSSFIQSEIKEYIKTVHGIDYLHPRIYKSKIKCSQEAHEAIRPTHIDVIDLEDTFDEYEKKIYNIIWKRTVSSQMSACIMEIYTMNISISNRPELFIAKTQKVLFDGYRKIYEEVKDEPKDGKDDDSDAVLSEFSGAKITIGMELKYMKITSSEKYQNPTPRFSEATLIKKMEKVGIGRPSTYSSIIEILQERNYVEKKDIKGKKLDIVLHVLEKDVIKKKNESLMLGMEKKKMIPNELGKNTISFLEKNFQTILDSNFTSQLEQKLDNIVNSNIVWNTVVQEFYDEFEPSVNKLCNEEKKRYIGVKDDKKVYAYVGKFGPVIQIGDNKNDIKFYKINDNVDTIELSDIENIIKSECGNGKRQIGIMENGKNVYAYVAKYGPVIQIGDDKKDIQYFKLDSDYNVETVQMEDLEYIMKYPYTLGQHNGVDLILKKGMYGIYLSYDGQNYKIDKEKDGQLTLEEGIELINNGGSKLLKKVGSYKIMNGKYGPYIEHKKKFYKIPKNKSFETLTKEDIDNMVSADDKPKVSKNINKTINKTKK